MTSIMYLSYCYEFYDDKCIYYMLVLDFKIKKKVPSLLTMGPMSIAKLI